MYHMCIICVCMVSGEISILIQSSSDGEIYLKNHGRILSNWMNSSSNLHGIMDHDFA